MFRLIPLCVSVLLCATACQPQQSSEPVATIGGSGGAQPVSTYRCGDTDLGVQLLGESASVSVDGSAPVMLVEQATTGGRTVFSDGQQTLTIEAGQLAWTPLEGSPVACSGG
jgi:hypothetical protein